MPAQAGIRPYPCLRRGDLKLPAGNTPPFPAKKVTMYKKVS